MTSTDSGSPGNERDGDAVHRAYADFTLSSKQREHHKLRLARAGQRRSISRILFPPAEVVAIVAAALLLVLTFTVWQSLDSQSDEASGTLNSASDAAATDRQLAIPFPPPDTCPVDGWVGPENRLNGQYPNDLVDSGSWTSSYFFDGSGISLNARLGLLYEGENQVFWLTNSYLPQDTAYRAERLDGESAPATFRFDEPFTVNADDESEDLTLRSATITFPTPGCWRISVVSQDASLRQIAYVYPTEEGRIQGPLADELREQ